VGELKRRRLKRYVYDNVYDTELLENRVIGDWINPADHSVHQAMPLDENGLSQVLKNLVMGCLHDEANMKQT